MLLYSSTDQPTQLTGVHRLYYVHHPATPVRSSLELKPKVDQKKKNCSLIKTGLSVLFDGDDRSLSVQSYKGSTKMFVLTNSLVWPSNSHSLLSPAS